MAEGNASTVRAILGVLADVSSSGRQEVGALTVPLDWFRWLAASATMLFRPDLDTRGAILESRGLGIDNRPSVPLDRAVGERLAAIDKVRAGAALRCGFLFVAGRRLQGDRAQRVLHPLLSLPVRIVVPPLAGPARVRAAGDVTVTELVSDAATRHHLEEYYALGGGALNDVASPVVPAKLLARLTGLIAFAKEAAKAAGFAVRDVVPGGQNPDELLRTDGLVVAAGVALYTATDVGGLSAAESLRAWSARVGDRPTALEAVYLPPPGGLDLPDDDGEVVSAYPLTPTQRRALVAGRHLPVSVVSGAAGNGKSHTVMALACDAIGRGESILVAAKSDAAVDALVQRLHAAPGPDPVVFGSSERRQELARRLADGELQPAASAALSAAGAALQHARRAHARLVADVSRQLQAEADFEGADPAVDDARLLAPRLFDPSCDLAAAGRLAEVACGPPPPWWRRRRRRRDVAELLSVAGASPEDLGDVQQAVAVAARARAAGDLVAAGGLDLASAWDRLAEAEDAVHTAAGRWLSLAGRSPERLNHSTLAAVGVLATALRAGRAARRAQLARLDERLTRALPLWIGTLADIEDLLPARPGLFDLVILDEASAIDQPLAAGALLRAARAVVVGDPHQLRHVSFLSDDALRKAVADHGIEDPILAGRLDARRNSVFDLAVAASPAVVLDEHFRSAPHLVDFVARRLYGGRFRVATRTPATDERDCIDVVRLSAERDGNGVVGEEVRTVVDLVRRQLAGGERSVGVISPFRAQADALEAALLDAFSLDELDRLDLRVGTVHAFQGNERDSVVVSFGIGTGAGARTWQFVDEPHLFAVLASRARKWLTLVLSADPPPGLAADYLAQADSPPRRPAAGPPPSAWTADVAADLAAVGFSTVTAYPCGRHEVDVCVGRGRSFAGVECAVHAEGPAAHIERHLSLRRSGWTLVGAFPSRWQDRRGELIVELTSALR
ncbi:MAG TPA: AAA domain-containing protein [Acidimicrobiales bacterium]|nr:AAA domain-containing protein [Acidimicrobiales bacterium]